MFSDVQRWEWEERPNKFFFFKFPTKPTTTVSTELLKVHSNLVGGGCARTGQTTLEVRMRGSPCVVGAWLAHTGLTAADEQ